MQLRDYLKMAGESVRDFAERTGIHWVSLYRYRSGERVPRPETILKIEEATAGAVTANDFVEAHRQREGRQCM